MAIAEQQKAGKKVGMIAENSSVYNPNLHIFSH